jgi:hypothetical protein
MATCTPIYMLPYIECSDRPCDQSDTWCAFAEAVEIQLDRLDAIVDRVVDTIPQFEVSVGEYTFIGTNRNVAFDAVGVDTDDMVDLTTDPFSFPINTLGRWFFYFRVATNGNTAVQGNIPVSVVNTPSLGVITIVQDYQDDGTNYPVPIDGSGFYRYPSAGARISLSVNTAALSIVSATFGGYWMGDL